MKLSCIIIEDEPLAAEKLESFIGQVSVLELKASFSNAVDGLVYLKTQAVDILFLDIQMKPLTGIELLETLKTRPYVIVTSAYAEYALKGYELSVFDYLLKPYSFERFMASVNKVMDNLKLTKPSPSEKANIFIKTEYRIENVPTDDILFVESMQAYLKIHLAGRKIMSKLTFKALLSQLPNDKFVQVHKSWAVAISKIESIEHNRIKIGQTIIPIGDNYKEAFYSMIQGG